MYNAMIIITVVPLAHMNHLAKYTQMIDVPGGQCHVCHVLFSLNVQYHLRRQRLNVSRGAHNASHRMQGGKDVHSLCSAAHLDNKKQPPQLQYVAVVFV